MTKNVHLIDFLNNYFPFTPQDKNSIYVIGRNELSLKLLKNYKLDGIVDDFYMREIWEGYPVKKSSKIKRNSLLINCSFSIYPLTAEINLSKRHKVIGYYNILKSFFDPVIPDFVIETRSDFSKNKSKWFELYEKLEDDESRGTLENIVNFRLTADYRHMKKYSVRLDDQYFEDFMHYKNEVFIDAGGYIGDTTQEFIKRYPDFNHIHFIEPSDANLSAAKNNASLISNLSKISFYDVGLSNKKGTMSFNENQGSSSKITESGYKKIKVSRLDDIIDDNVTFIKMDLEGWEMKALEGAKKHIVESHPKLAIAIYHKPSDFHEIFNFVFNLRSDYKVYIRHYTEGWSETIMYFLPK